VRTGAGDGREARGTTGRPVGLSRIDETRVDDGTATASTTGALSGVRTGGFGVATTAIAVLVDEAAKPARLADAAGAASRVGLALELRLAKTAAEREGKEK
jgi:hypothetical protein